MAVGTASAGPRATVSAWFIGDTGRKVAISDAHEDRHLSTVPPLNQNRRHSNG